MALDANALKQNLLSQLGFTTGPSAYPTTPIESAQKISQAFRDYASSMIAGPGTPISAAMDTGKTAMQAVLASILSPGPDPAFAQKFASSVEAFLAALTSPGSFVGPGPGSVMVLIPSAAALLPSLTAVFAAPLSAPPQPTQAQIDQANDQRIGDVATALHAYAISGHTVTYILPPPATPILAPIN